MILSDWYCRCGLEHTTIHSLFFPPPFKWTHMFNYTIFKHYRSPEGQPKTAQLFSSVCLTCTQVLHFGTLLMLPRGAGLSVECWLTCWCISWSRAKVIAPSFKCETLCLWYASRAAVHLLPGESTSANGWCEVRTWIKPVTTFQLLVPTWVKVKWGSSKWPLMRSGFLLPSFVFFMSAVITRHAHT